MKKTKKERIAGWVVQSKMGNGRYQICCDCRIMLKKHAEGTMDRCIKNDSFYGLKGRKYRVRKLVYGD